MKSILHIYNGYYPPTYGGIEKYINTVCEGLKDKFKMRVLVSSGGFKTIAEKINGIDVVRIPELARIQSTPLCPSMPYWIKKINPDIIHFHLPCPTAMISWFITKPKAKTVVTYHSDIVRQKWAMPFYAPLLDKFLSKVDRIIATSPNYIQSSSFLSKRKGKCVIIPIGIDIQKYHSGESDGKTILFVGKLRYYKGLQYLISAMQNIQANLVIIGTGNEHNKLRNLAKKLGLTNKVKFMGDISEEVMPEYYSKCTIFVLPSTERSEAFGISQLEAMASGKPIVSTNIPTGVPWINQNNTTGIIIPPKNSTAISEAINKLLANEELRNKLGNSGRDRVEKFFSKEKMLDELSRLYFSLD